MQFTIPTNFDPELIPSVAAYSVREVYGKLPEDSVGGGRLSGILPRVTLPKIRDHVRLCEKFGIRFNYLLNASHSDNSEYTCQGQQNLKKLTDHLIGIGIRDFTVATPYLLRYLKLRCPDARVKISVFAQVGDVRKAKQWQEMGADAIVLDSMLVNREFEELEAIRKAVQIPLFLLANNNCTYGCSLSPYHMNVLAAGSRSKSKAGGFFTDYCFLYCTAHKLRHPEGFLIADWIRPEDLYLYEALGYENFKLAGRNLTTRTILERVKAYHSRRYDGNLLDLVQDFGQNRTTRMLSVEGWNRVMQWSRWFWISRPKKFRTVRRLWNLNRKRGFFSAAQLEPPAYVDNRALDGFMERILSMGGCRNRLCEECRFCHRTAQHAVHLNQDRSKLVLDDQEPLLQEMENGSFWV